MALDDETDLPQRQVLFAYEFVKDLNGSAAYRRAGYKAKNDSTAEVCSCQLLRKPKVKALVDKLKGEILAKARLQAFQAWQELSAIARSDIGEILDFNGPTARLRPANEIPEMARRAIKSMKVKRYVQGSGETAQEVEVTEFALWDKPGAVIAALKALGELKERTIVSGDPDNPIQHEHTHKVVLPDRESAEFKSLPAGERLRIIREALNAVN